MFRYFWIFQQIYQKWHIFAVNLVLLAYLYVLNFIHTILFFINVFVAAMARCSALTWCLTHIIFTQISRGKFLFLSRFLLNFQSDIFPVRNQGFQSEHFVQRRMLIHKLLLPAYPVDWWPRFLHFWSLRWLLILWLFGDRYVGGRILTLLNHMDVAFVQNERRTVSLLHLHHFVLCQIHKWRRCEVLLCGLIFHVLKKWWGIRHLDKEVGADAMRRCFHHFCEGILFGRYDWCGSLMLTYALLKKIKRSRLLKINEVMLWNLIDSLHVVWSTHGIQTGLGVILLSDLR